MATSLDRTKPFGTIFGDEAGRMYEQDGAYFLGDGSPWQAPEAAAGDVAAPKAGGKKGKADAAPESPADDSQLAAQLGQQ